MEATTEDLQKLEDDYFEPIMGSTDVLMDVSKMSKTEYIVWAMANSFQGDESLKVMGLVFPKEKRKLFPFHWFTNFHNSQMIEGNLQMVIPELPCDYCQNSDQSGNGSYYTAYLVMEKDDELKVACCRKCIPSTSIEWHDQQYGFREPLTFPKRFIGNKLYSIIWTQFIEQHTYQLKQFAQGITLKQYNQVSNNLSTSSYWYSGRSSYTIGMKGSKIHLQQGKKHQTFKPSEVIKMINEMIIPEGNTETTTPSSWNNIFSWKEKKFSINVSLGESEGMFAIKWDWHLQQPSGASKGDAHSSGFIYEYKKIALRSVIGPVNTYILKKLKEFSQYHWASHFIKAIPEASRTESIQNENTKPSTEEKIVVKKVDGLDQIQIFELPEVKQPRNPDAELFGYIAKNKIDRQRFKRKATQLIEKLKELPALERNALLRALNSKFTPPNFNKCK